VALLAGCSAHAATPVPRAASPAASPRAGDARPDPLLALAAALPAGADRCVLARPIRLRKERAALLARISQAEPFAWLAVLGVEAYAMAHLERRDGPSARVTLLWLTRTSGDLQAAFDAHSGIALRWDQRACSGAGCPPRARVLDEHVVRIEHGVFPVRAEPGAEAHCARMAAAAPAAIELGFTRSRRLLDELVGVPLRSTSALTPAAHGVHVRREALMLTSAEAMLAYQQGVMAEERGFALSWLATDLRVEQVDSTIHTDFDVLWDDLELAAQDDVRTGGAEREADARERAELPVDAPPDVRSRQDVLAQLAYRLDRAERSTEPERGAQLAAARALLDAACAAQPDDEGLALLRAELPIAELNDAAEGRTLARAGAQRFETRARWHALERRAAALQGEAALASTLTAQRLARGRDATTFAREILERVKAGSSFEDAEREVLDLKP
jgi:hypothetical protein